MKKLKAIGILTGVFTVGTVAVAVACKYVYLVFSFIF